MTISLKYTYNDFDTLRRAGIRWRLIFGNWQGVVLRLMVACVLMTFGVAYVTWRDSWIWASCFILPAIPVVMLLLVTFHGRSHPFGSLDKWNKDPLSQGMVSLEINEAGIRVIGPDSRSFYPWSFDTNLVEYPEAIIVKLSHPVFVLIPKRAFADDVQIREFKTIVDSHARQACA